MGSGISTSSSETLAKRYRIANEDFLIGEGGSSSVLIAKDLQTNIEVALKKVNLRHGRFDSSTLDVLFNELNCFKRIGSAPFIVQLHSAYRIKSSCYFALEYLGGGDLRRFLRLNDSLQEDTAAYVIASIGSALHHMHCIGIIHRDVKPENIVFDLMGRPYLTDFGVSCLSTSENPIPISSSSSGTLMYLAPEVLTPINHHSHQADFWSLGMIAYEIMFEHRPFAKHCPPSFIQFSVNEYAPMWNHLLKLSTSSPCVDFKAIHEHSLQEYNESNANGILHFPNLNIYLNEDGTTPSSLQVPLPQSSSKTFTNEFRSLISGLLDVRIPQRLGNLSNFSNFADHVAFVKHKLLFSQLHLMSPPASLQSVAVSHSRRSPSFHDTFSSSFSPSPSPSSELLEAQDFSLIEEKLSKFHFVSPVPNSRPSVAFPIQFLTVTKRNK
jgi:serine/threonine protein kinase